MDVGFIGVGGIAQPHLDHLDDIDDVSVSVVCDVDEAAAREAADPRGATVYTDHEEMYEREGGVLDAVYVCIPPFAHTTQELMAAERGIPFLVEKPIALSRDLAEEVSAAVAANDVVTQVGYQRRYSPLLERAGEILDGRRIALLDGRRVSSVPGTAWWGIEAESGGQVVEMSTHDFDVARYLGGEVERVSAYGGQEVVTEAIDFEDATTASMRHESGAVSNVSSTCAGAGWGGGADFAVVADGAELYVHWGDRLTGTADGEEVAVEAEGASAQRREDEAFIEAVRADDPDLPRSPYADAARTLDLTLSVTEAIDGGEVVLS